VVPEHFVNVPFRQHTQNCYRHGIRSGRGNGAKTLNLTLQKATQGITTSDILLSIYYAFKRNVIMLSVA